MTERNRLPADPGVRKIAVRAEEATGLGFPVDPHMHRHFTGFNPPEDARDTRAIRQYRGHEIIRHTVRRAEFGRGRSRWIREE